MEIDFLGSILFIRLPMMKIIKIKCKLVIKKSNEVTKNN